MSTHEIPLIVSSAIEAGAVNKSADGSSFSIFLEDPIDIPKTATSCFVTVQTSTIWWVIPNIITGISDKFRLDPGTGVFTDLFIPQGLYDLSGLQSAAETAAVNAGLPAGTFTFLSDSATQKVIIRFNVIAGRVDFSVVQTFRLIVGWTSIIVGPSGFIGESFLAPNTAAFNQIDFFLIHSDIVPRGIRLNNQYSNILSQVLISVRPGSQNIDSPFNPVKVPAWDLIGGLRKRVKFWLTDQQNRLVNTNNENWTARIIIKYTEN